MKMSTSVLVLVWGVGADVTLSSPAVKMTRDPPKRKDAKGSSSKRSDVTLTSLSDTRGDSVSNEAI